MSGKQLPSGHQKDRETAQEALQAQREEIRRKQARIFAAFDWLLKQANGRVVWAEIFRLCGYNKASLAYFATGDVAPLKTECRDAQRVVYIELRKMISSPELLAQAEFEAEFGHPKEDK